MQPLGKRAKRIESEYLERLNKVRYGLDGGWQPPGLMLKGGNADQRAAAIERLRELAVEDGFSCSLVTLGPELTLRDTARVRMAALADAGFDPAAKVRDVAASSRARGKDGWVVLLSNVDRFEGTARERAEGYREITRWMATLAWQKCPGLFCLLAVTPEFEAAVADPEAELRSLATELTTADTGLLEAAEGGITTLRHEASALELLELEF